MSNYYWIVLQTSWFWRGNSWPLRKDFPKYTKLNRPHLFLWMRHCTYHSIIQMQMIMNTIGFCFVSLLFHTPLHKGPVVLEACPSFCFQFTQCRENAKIDLFLTLALYVFVIVRRAGLLWSQQDFEWRWSVPLFKCLTVLEFSFILFDLCLLITFFNFIMNYVPIVTFWIFTYHKIWILSIMFCSIWSYWIIYFLACL